MLFDNLHHFLSIQTYVPQEKFLICRINPSKRTLDGAKMKAKVHYLIVCEQTGSFEINDAKKEAIIEPISFIKKKIPFVIDFTLAMSISVFEENDYKLRLLIINPDGTGVALETDIVFPEFKEQATSSFGLSVRDIDITRPGEFIIHAYINDEKMYTQSFHVYNGEESNV